MDGYLDGELDPITSKSIEQHLRDCPNCDHAFKTHGSLIRLVEIARTREQLLLSSRVISSLPIFGHPDDTTSDTKLSTVFVTIRPMTSHATNLAKQFAASVR